MITHYVSLKVSLRSFKKVKNVEMKVLKFHLVCLKSQNLSYTLKYPTVKLMKLNQNTFLKKFHKFTNNSFRIVIAKDPYFIQKIKTIINRVLSTKGIVVVVHVTTVKANVMQKLDGINMTIQLKV